MNVLHVNRDSTRPSQMLDDETSRSSIADYPPEAQAAIQKIYDYRDAREQEHRDRRLNILRKLIVPERKSELEGWIKFMKKIEREAAESSLISDISSYKYGTDRSFLRESTPAQVWEAVKRRAAWKYHPFRMSFLTFTQLVLCIIIIISATAKVNIGTVIMAALFVISVAASNPLALCKDVANWIVKADRQHGRALTTAVCIFISPMIGIVFGVAFILDLMVGKIIDVSIGSMWNIVVRIFVVYTAISVGLRSGNPINAIQTFAGFDFIDHMDEMVIDSLDIDYKELADPENYDKADSTKMLVIRLSIYILTPIITALFFYVTISEECYAFCDDGQ